LEFEVCLDLLYFALEGRVFCAELLKGSVEQQDCRYVVEVQAMFTEDEFTV
jgi:hypothetical protein